MEERDRSTNEGEKDTEIRKEPQMRGSLGMPPSGGELRRPGDREKGVPEFERERARGSVSDDDRMSER